MSPSSVWKRIVCWLRGHDVHILSRASFCRYVDVRAVCNRCSTQRRFVGSGTFWYEADFRLLEPVALRRLPSHIESMLSTLYGGREILEAWDRTAAASKQRHPDYPSQPSTSIQQTGTRGR
jgi:hypothetical protein